MNDQTLNPSELLEISIAYEVAWLSHILHGESPEDCLIVIKKAVATLKPSGLIMVHDFIYRLLTYEPKDENLFQVNII